MSGSLMKRWVIGKFSIGRLLRSFVLIYGIVALYVFFNADRMIFVPPAASYRDTPAIIKLVSEPGIQISALHLTHPTAEQTIIYSHGNGEDIGQIRFILEILQDAGFNVFAYDYRGYGTSQGTPTEAGSYRDIEAAYNYVTGPLRVPPERVILLGRSVGSGPSVDLASRQPIGGLILENGFTSIFRVVLPIPVLPFDKFVNITKIGKVEAPVFMIHATLDDTIPLSHGEAMFAAAREPKQAWWVEGAGHNDLVEVAGTAYPQRIQAFGKQVLGRQE